MIHARDELSYDLAVRADCDPATLCNLALLHRIPYRAGEVKEPYRETSGNGVGNGRRDPGDH